MSLQIRGNKKSANGYKCQNKQPVVSASCSGHHLGYIGPEAEACSLQSAALGSLRTTPRRDHSFDGPLFRVSLSCAHSALNPPPLPAFGPLLSVHVLPTCPESTTTEERRSPIPSRRESFVDQQRHPSPSSAAPSSLRETLSVGALSSAPSYP